MHVYMCVLMSDGAHGGQIRVLDLKELEIQVAGCELPIMTAENQTLVLENSKHS